MPDCPDGRQKLIRVVLNHFSGPIRQHSFFRGVDWKKFECRQMAPPFKPLVVSTTSTLYNSNSIVPIQKSANDTSNFDDDFTQEKAMLTPIQDKNLLASIVGISIQVKFKMCKFCRIPTLSPISATQTTISSSFNWFAADDLPWNGRQQKCMEFLKIHLNSFPKYSHSIVPFLSSLHCYFLLFYSITPSSVNFSPFLLQ